MNTIFGLLLIATIYVYVYHQLDIFFKDLCSIFSIVNLLHLQKDVLVLYIRLLVFFDTVSKFMDPRMEGSHTTWHIESLHNSKCRLKWLNIYFCLISSRAQRSKANHMQFLISIIFGKYSKVRSQRS